MRVARHGLWTCRRAAIRLIPAALRFSAACRGGVLTLALLLPCPVIAADLTCEQPAVSNAPGSEKLGAQDELDELDELVVTDGKSTDHTEVLRAWLKRLMGQYTYEGYVDLCGKGNAVDQRPVTGRADCIGFPAATSVQCAITVRWPEVRGQSGARLMGGVSNLTPAMVVYGVEPRRWGIQFMQVDNRGIAEGGMGLLVGDTLMSREPCLGTPGPCRKITQITAKPGGDEISIRVDVEIDHEAVLRHVFLLHRVANNQKVERSGASP